MTPNLYRRTSLFFVHLIAALLSTNAFAQLTVAGGQTAFQLAQTLAGPGITVSNAILTGAPDAAGLFDGTASNIGMNSGVILCTGPITVAPGPNNSGSAGNDNGQPGNAQLNGLAGAGTFNAIVLEFDFIPLSNSIEFNYVFGSEEYPEFVNSGYNDAFAFFISGPGIPGTQNMALIPGTATPVTIDNLNAGANNQYYVNNAGGGTVQYDAFTTVLTASANVQACETYHLEIMIADAGDGIWDSGVFLEEGSLTSAVVEITTTTATADSTAYENCSNATVTFTLSETISTDYTVNYNISGTATNGVDFPAIPNSVTIPANTLSTSFQVEPVFDGTAEGLETLIIDVQTSVCGSDTIIIYINDVSPVTVEAFGDTAFCDGTAMLWAVAQGGAGDYTFSWSNGMTGDTIFVTPATTTTYTVTSNDFCASTVPTPTDDATVTLYPIPVADAGPDIPYCAGDPVNLSSASSGSDFEWFDITNNQIAGTDSSITLNPVGDVDYRLIVWSGVCSDTDYVSITELPASPAQAVGDTAFCAGGLAQLDVDSAAGSTFSWTPALSLSNAIAQNPVASPAQTTTYFVTITTASGCIKTDSVVVEVYASPQVNFSAPAVCLNTTSQFTNASTISSGTIQSYQWDFDDGNSSVSPNASNIYAQEGTYDVELLAVSNNGCADSITIQHVVNPLPVADFNFSNDCEDKLIIFTDASSTSTGTIDQWDWDFGNGQTSTEESPLPQLYPNDGLFDVSLSVTTDQGCFDDTTQTVEIYPVPTALFSFDSVCFGNDISFTDLSAANGNYPITDWNWDFSDGQSSTDQNPQITFPQYGLYSATLTVTTEAGCIDQLTSGSAAVHPLPVPMFDANLKNCLNDTTLFNDESSVPNLLNDQIVTWNWDFGDGNTSTNENTQNVYGAHGFYDVSLTTTTDKGCTATVTHSVEIFPLPDVSFTSDVTSGCQPLRVLFSEQVSIPAPYSISQYIWDLGEGNGLYYAQNPLNIYNNDTVNELSVAQYDVSLIAVSGNGCVAGDTIENYITEYPKPDALFSAEPWITDVLETEIDFENRSSENVTEWFWDFGDGGESSEENPTHDFPEVVGEYDVTQYVYTQYGCADTAYGTVKVEPIFTFYIPNTFTPDANDVNETFFGDGEGFTDYQMRIYDRWGELLFESNDKDFPWDGTYKEKQVEQGVYVYVFVITDWRGNPHRYIGHLTLLR